jgi:hypothetical protein
VATDFFRIFRGLELDGLVRLLSGVGAPGGTPDTDSALPGSYYTDRATGELWTKVAPGPGTGTWQQLASRPWVLSGFQPQDPDLTAIAGLTGLGYLTRVGTNAWATRTILGTVGNISVTDGAGTSGNTTIDLVTTGVTPGTYTKLTVDAYGRATAGANPTTLAGYGITDAQPLNAFLTDIANATASGIMVKSGTNLLLRAINPGSPRITVTNPDGTLGNVVIDLGAVGLNDLTDVSLTSPSAGDALVFDGTNWVNASSSASSALKLYAENPVVPTPPSATGANAIALGSEAEAQAPYSVAIGPQALGRFPGITQANGGISDPGDAQSGRYLLRSVTYDATPTELFLNGTGGGDRLNLPPNTTWVFTVTVVGHREDLSGGHAGYRFKGVAYRDGIVNTFLLGKPTKEVLAETHPAWDASVGVYTDALVVKVVGEMYKVIRWVALVETVEVSNPI